MSPTADEPAPGEASLSGLPSPSGQPASIPPRRDRAVRRSFVASIFGKILSVACTLAQVPLLIRLLGTTGYGAWVLLLGLSVLLNALDFGLGLGMQQRMTEAFAKNNDHALRQNFFAGCTALVILGVVAILIGAPLIFLFDWAAVLHLTDPSWREELRPLLLLTLVLSALGLPFNALPRLAVAVQQGWLQGFWIALGSITTLLAVAVAGYTQSRLCFIVVITLTIPLLQGLGLGIHLFLRLRWGAVFPPVLGSPERAALWRASLLYIPTQFSLALFSAVPSIALGWISGMVVVAQYNLLQRLYSPFVQGQMMLLGPLLPVYIEAHHRGDFGWMRRALQKVLGITVLLVFGIIIVTWQSPFLVTHWTATADTVPDPALRWLTAGWISSQLFLLVPTYFLYGAGELRRMAQAATVGLILSMAGWFLVGHYFGAKSAIMAGTIGLVLGSSPGIWWTMKRQIPQPAPSQ